MFRPLLSLLCLLALGLAPDTARAFCGFYVAKADSKLFNDASRVVMVRDGDRTVLTLANDYRGDPREFALVIPVPTSIQREQIHVAESALIDHLDAYSAPRLVEYFDADPCAERLRMEMSRDAMKSMAEAPNEGRARSLGVLIEASYTVGEYDILILSARESRGLVRWLRESGYRVPEKAASIVGSYLRQGMRFFVAKVNLDEKRRLGTEFLRPLQVAFESRKFMLPIRLGTVNAEGPQDLYVYTLTRTGRVETTNYRTLKLPSDAEVPAFVKAEFGDFYKALFSRQVEQQDMRAVFLEYAWDMAWCDPCAADPLSLKELRELGVFWMEGEGRGRAGAPNVFLTRLHVRYDAEHFPEDLRFHETGDRSNFQGRYILRHAWQGQANCPAAERYFRQLEERQQREAETLASLTGWDLAGIRRRLHRVGAPGGEEPWWGRLWTD